jgi:hypothetical protein
MAILCCVAKNSLRGTIVLKIYSVGTDKIRVTNIISQLVLAFSGRNRFISTETDWSPYKKSKTTRDAYLGKDLSIHVNHGPIHLVTQSL